MLHFGSEDRSIPQTDIERIRAAYPQGVYHLYAAAGHAFSNHDRAQNYNAEAAALARERTLEFLARHIG
jgi:carboxymethylenebutenolidase